MGEIWILKTRGMKHITVRTNHLILLTTVPYLPTTVLSFSLTNHFSRNTFTHCYVLLKCNSFTILYLFLRFNTCLQYIINTLIVRSWYINISHPDFTSILLSFLRVLSTHFFLLCFNSAWTISCKSPT